MLADVSEGCDRSHVDEDMKIPGFGETGTTEFMANDPVVEEEIPEPGVDGGGRDGPEATQHRGQNAPYTPTQVEIDRHALTHLPYRKWCPLRVKGKGKATAHRSLVSHHEVGVPVISIDYAYLCDTEIVEEFAEVHGQPTDPVTGKRLQP